MKNEKIFKIIKQDKRTKARVGEIRTPHGKILTPVFVPVGSQASVKSLTPQDLRQIGVQVFFVNTYHLYLRPGVEVIQKLGGIHKFMGWEGPVMSDSGGFQIFSLGRAERNVRVPLFSETRAGVGGKPKQDTPSLSDPPIRRQEDKLNLNLTADQYSSKRAPSLPFGVEIDYDGVTFRSHLDGSPHRFTPEKSMEIQQKLGTDIMVAFDECSPYPVDHEYAEVAMKRTHRWALRSLSKYHATVRGNYSARQALFGVVQGSVYKDLREESAKYICSLDFDGIAIGGVAVGETKREMYQVLDWVMPILPKEKPVHLLGVGEIDDIFASVERGVDMFDCVMPTRLGRMGHILTKLKIKNEKLTPKPDQRSVQGYPVPNLSSGTRVKMTDKNSKFTFDITKSIFVDDAKPLEESCDCFVCRNFSRGYLNHLFRARELLAYRLASYHNLYFLEKLFSQIREAIGKGEFLKLKAAWL